MLTPTASDPGDKGALYYTVRPVGGVGGGRERQTTASRLSREGHSNDSPLVSKGGLSVPRLGEDKQRASVTANEAKPRTLRGATASVANGGVTNPSTAAKGPAWLGSTLPSRTKARH